MTAQLPVNPDPPVFTYETGAPYIGMTVRQLQDATRAGKVSHIKVGMYTRFTQRMLDDYLMSQTVQAKR